MYTIQKKFKFEYAHRLHNLKYESACKNIHGHSAKVLIEIGCEELKDSMVIDFTKLKEFQKWLDNTFDHSLIISKYDTKLLHIAMVMETKIFTLPYDLTTAEHMAEFFTNQVKILIGDSVKSLKYIKVTMYETENNCASFEAKIEKEIIL